MTGGRGLELADEIVGRDAVAAAGGQVGQDHLRVALDRQVGPGIAALGIVDPATVERPLLGADEAPDLVKLDVSNLDALDSGGHELGAAVADQPHQAADGVTVDVRDPLDGADARALDQQRERQDRLLLRDAHRGERAARADRRAVAAVLAAPELVAVAVLAALDQPGAAALGAAARLRRGRGLFSAGHEKIVRPLYSQCKHIDGDCLAILVAQCEYKGLTAGISRVYLVGHE